MTAEPILEVANAVKSFDGLTAVAGASFTVEKGSITALIGPNGAGKTTMFDLLSGFAKPDSGAIRFAGQPITGKAPHRIARLGLVRTFQLTRVLAGMSVIDNMLLAAPRQPGQHLYSLLTAPRQRGRRQGARRGPVPAGNFRPAIQGGGLCRRIVGGPAQTPGDSAGADDRTLDGAAR